MSVWKKTSKTNQKTHRERHQPEARKHLGLLEKKKDYVKRAQDYNEKQATLKLLRKRALNKNPDEFYHHMINSKVEGGVHKEIEKAEENTPEQTRLMQTQDLKYILSKRTQELKKIERIQSQLHLSSVNVGVRNKHKYFTDNDKMEVKHEFNNISKVALPDFNMKDLTEAARRQKNMYKELAKRIQREKELSVIQQKMELKRYLQNKKSVLPPKRVRKGSKDAAPIYLWKYERKK